MSDFIREVDEDYRRERALGFLRRFQVPLALAVVAIVAGAGGWRTYVDHRAAVAAGANDRYQQAERAAREGHAVDAERDFRALAGDGPVGYAVLSRLRAAEVAAAHDPEAAAKSFDAIASDDGAGSPALRDLARFRGAVLRIDHEDPAAFEAQYGRFALEAFAFRDGMRELLALAALKRGDAVAAEKYLNALIADPLAPPALRNRAQAVRELAAGGQATAMTHQPGPARVVPIGGGATPSQAPAPPPAEATAAEAPPAETLSTPQAAGATPAAAPAPKPAAADAVPTPDAPAPGAPAAEMPSGPASTPGAALPPPAR